MAPSRSHPVQIDQSMLLHHAMNRTLFRATLARTEACKLRTNIVFHPQTLQEIEYTSH